MQEGGAFGDDVVVGLQVHQRTADHDIPDLQQRVETARNTAEYQGIRMIFADQHLGGGTCGDLPHTAHAHDDRHLAELSGDQIGAVPAAALDSMQALDDGFSFLRQRTQHRNAMMSLHTPIVGHG